MVNCIISPRILIYRYCNKIGVRFVDWGFYFDFAVRAKKSDFTEIDQLLGKFCMIFLLLFQKRLSTKVVHYDE